MFVWAFLLFACLLPREEGKKLPIAQMGKGAPPLPSPYKLSPRCIFSHPRKKGKTREGKEGESFRAPSLLGRSVAKTVGYFFLAKRDSQIEIGSEPRSIPHQRSVKKKKFQPPPLPEGGRLKRGGGRRSKNVLTGPPTLLTFFLEQSSPAAFPHSFSLRLLEVSTSYLGTQGVRVKTPPPPPSLRISL